MIRNFDQNSNGQVCSCGEHHGVGVVGPGDRAARYARMRDKLPDYFTKPMQSYLASFEARHGRVLYMMDQCGVAEGGKDGFLPKGTPIMRPFCTSYIDAPTMPGVSPKRLRHEVEEWA